MDFLRTQAGEAESDAEALGWLRDCFEEVREKPGYTAVLEEKPGS